MDNKIDNDKKSKDKPTTWDLRQVLEQKANDLVSNGPGDNVSASFRLLKIIDFIEDYDSQ